MYLLKCLAFVMLSLSPVIQSYNYNYGNEFTNYYRDYGNYGRYRSGQYLPAPFIKSLSAFDPAGFQVQWTRVDNYDDMDPVMGYKIKIWEVNDKKLPKYERVNGAVMLVGRESQYQQELESRRVSDSEPFVLVLPGRERTYTRISNIKLNTLYEIRVQAFTSAMDGQLSQPARIKVVKDSDGRHKEVYIAT